MNLDLIDALRDRFRNLLPGENLYVDGDTFGLPSYPKYPEINIPIPRRPTYSISFDEIIDPSIETARFELVDRIQNIWRFNGVYT